MMPRIAQAALFFVAPFAPAAFAQAVPAATGPAIYNGFPLPSVSGALTSSISASQRFQLGYQGTNQSAGAVALSGNLGYLSNSTRYPFSAVYGASYLANFTGQSSEVVQSLSLSQEFAIGRFSGIIADSVRYLPEAPSSGLSGVPGIGDANLAPGSVGGEIVPGPLTTQIAQVSNSVSVSVSRALTGRTSAIASASQHILRFLGATNATQADSNLYSVSGGLNHEIDARTSYGANYSYSHSSFGEDSASISSQRIAGQFSRKVSRRLSFSASAGPQRTSSSNSALIPTRTRLSAAAEVSFAGREVEGVVSYSQGSGTSTGLVGGTQSDSLSAGLSRSFHEVVNLSAHLGYNKSASLIPGSYNTESVVGGFQANRAIFRHASIFASYTAQHQIGNGAGLPSFALRGLVQNIGYGITYSPEAIHFGHH